MREMKLLDKYIEDKSNPFREEYGWRQSTVKIRLPKEKRKFPSEADAPELEILGVHHRSLTDIITHVFESDVSQSFNMMPFDQFWTTPDHWTVRVFWEAYASPALMEAYKEINALQLDPGDNLERVVASLMVWDASLWPFYMYFGNQSKYTRGKPTARASHHLAYIPTLPNNLQDIYVDIFGEAMLSDVHTHLKRELMQAIWSLLLDGKFMEAYEHGIVIRCSHGITRRVFPPDYPEKVLLATIKFLGGCPWPHCLVKKADLHKMGMKLDMKNRVTHKHLDNFQQQRSVEEARTLIFKLGVPVSGSHVKAILNKASYVPICSAFSERLAKHGFNMFDMFLVNQLHEFELGAWKAKFTHLLRILHAAGGNAIQDLNKW
ncbi:hypothetical protein P692DRAFT_201842935 [Suillus brevipes Sb2]|nr:hypothetical protein P692DRAFT_201842935 [Suillus brevipes Sb2]